jgi:hypothetical protein
MRLITQFIQTLVSRFRNDVYLESTKTGTIASGGNLGLDSNNKIVKADTEAGELAFNGNTASGVLTYGGTSTIDVESTFKYKASGTNYLDIDGLKIHGSVGATSYDSITVAGYIELPSVEGFGDIGLGSTIKVADFTSGTAHGASLTLSSGDAYGTNMNGSSMRFYLGTRTGTGSLGSFFFYGGDGTEIASINNTLIALGDNDDVEYVVSRRSHLDGNGGNLAIKAGSASNGQTDKAGGDLELHAGRGTGALDGGNINFYSHKRGSTGTTIGTPAVLAAINPGTTNTDFIIYEDAGASTDDYYRVRVKANGETIVTTQDNAGTAAHYKVSADGDISFVSATGVVSAGWHGSTTRMKILPRDFTADDGGRPPMIDDTGSDRWVESYLTNKLYASIPIPAGYKATECIIYGSGTSAVTVYEADINSKVVTSKATGNIGTLITGGDFTDVGSDTTNYLLIELAQTSGEEVYGGYITIANI